MNCPGCGATRTRALGPVADRLFRTTDERFTLAQCDACTLRFMHPLPTPERLASYYPSGYWVGPTPAGAGRGLRARLTELYRRTVLRDHVRFVGRVLAAQRAAGRPLRMLDVGCGDGSLFTALRRHPALRGGAPVLLVGLDQSRDAARAVQARGAAAVLGQLTRGPFRPRSFSLITMFHFLEHVSPPGPWLRAARELLADDGELIVQVPNAASWQAALFGTRWGGYDPPRHLIHYSAQTLHATLAEHGFVVTRTTTASLRDNPTTLANSLVPGLYPPARARHGERGAAAWLGDLAYLAVTLAALPFALLEGACGRGAAVMVECRKR